MTKCRIDWIAFVAVPFRLDGLPVPGQSPLEQFFCRICERSPTDFLSVRSIAAPKGVLLLEKKKGETKSLLKRNAAAAA